jgi:stalled ribosome rescue protein Dom34
MQHYHAVVWLDHREARVYFFDRNSFDEVEFAAKTPNQQLQHKSGSIAGKRTPDDQHFFHEIVNALKPAREWLITGPGNAKLELVKHVHKHDHSLSDHIVGVETSDHPSDKQLVAHARSYFKAADRMRT